MVMSTQMKVKWTDTPGKKITASKGCRWVRGQNVKGGINLYPQLPMQFITHINLLYRDTCSTDSKIITLTVSTAQ